VVVILAAATGDTLRVLPAGHTAGGAAWDARRGRLYVCNRFHNDVSVLDVPAGKEVARIPVSREPVAAALTPDGRTLVVAHHLPDARTDLEHFERIAARVLLCDTRTLATRMVALPHGASSVRDVCVTADGSYALVTHVVSNFTNVPFRVDMGWVNVNVVSMIDLRRKKLLGTIGLDELQRGAANPWGVAVTANGSHLCVSAAGTHELCVVPTAQLLLERARRTMSPLPGAWPVYPSLGTSLWQRIALSGKGPRGVVVVGSTAYVAQYFSDSLAVVDLQAATDAAVRTIELGPAPELTPVRWGQLLFEDATICYQQWQSCASCHPDARGDGLVWDLMNDGVGNPKSSKSMLWSHRTPPAMAQSARETAEDAVRSGIVNILFSHRPEAEAAAIDAYLRTLEPIPSPHLHDGRLSEAAERGRRLFESDAVGCHRCHPAPLYTDCRTHSIGTAQSPRFNNRYDTPTLVEVWRTAPYLHDGRYRTVYEVLHEGRHGLAGPLREELTEEDLRDLAAFVLSL
jgi:YVTN family beta-propeller protein